MTKPITNDALDALEAAAKEATPGPWTCYQPKGYSFDQINADNGLCVAGDVDALYSTGNGPYIAAANPQTILALIARLRAAEDDKTRLTEKNKRLAEALKPFADRADIYDPPTKGDSTEYDCYAGWEIKNHIRQPSPRPRRIGGVMTKAQLAALEKVFAAEIEGRLPFQSKAKIYRTLCDEGYLEPMERNFGYGRFGVVVRGYQLSHAGRLAYCQSC